MTLDERLQALIVRHELFSRDMQLLKAFARQTGENIRAHRVIAQTTRDSIKSLELIAVRHERLDHLEQH